MRNLDLHEMENVQGGDTLSCAMGLVGFGGSLWGAGSLLVAASTGIGALVIGAVVLGASIWGLAECNEYFV